MSKGSTSSSDLSGDQQVAVLILGPHRSGTSATTRALNLAGISVGGEDAMVPPADDNPEGYWEHAQAVEAHETALRRLGLAWDTVKELPKGWMESEAGIALQFEAERILDTLQKTGSIFAIKDPRMCFFAPLWHKVLAARNVRVVYLLCARNPIDVGASLTKRNKLSFARGLGLWESHSIAALANTRGHQRAFLNYDVLMEDGVKAVKQVFDRLQLGGIDEKALDTALKGFLRPSLRHSQSSEEDFKARGVPEAVRATFRLYNDAAKTGKVDESREEELLKEFDIELQMYPLWEKSTWIEGFWTSEGEPFNGENRLTLNSRVSQGLTSFSLRLGKGDVLRIDPAAAPCVVSVHEILVEGVLPSGNSQLITRFSGLNEFGGLETANAAGQRPDDRALHILFLSHDPQIVLRDKRFADESFEAIQVTFTGEVLMLEPQLVELFKLFDLGPNSFQIASHLNQAEARFQWSLAKLEGLDTWLSSQDKRLNYMGDEMTATNKIMAEFAHAVSEFRILNAQKDSKIDRLRFERDHFEKTIKAIERSFIWRSTRPIVKLLNKVRGR